MNQDPNPPAPHPLQSYEPNVLRFHTFSAFGCECCRSDHKTPCRLRAPAIAALAAVNGIIPAEPARSDFVPGKWDASQLVQPGWNHVMQAFVDGAREARMNPDAGEADFGPAADGYVKRVHESIDPVGEAALRTGDFDLTIPDPALVALAKKDEGSREARMVTIETDADGKATVWCDPEIAPIVAALNKAGLRTDWSCSGHGFRPGVIGLVDGRQLVIAKDDAELALIQELFPVDINGNTKGSAK